MSLKTRCRAWLSTSAAVNQNRVDTPDRAKGLRAAITGVFGKLARIHRWILHIVSSKQARFETVPENPSARREKIAPAGD